MKETIDLLTAFENIQNYAINSFKPSYVTADSKPSDVAQYSDFRELPHSIIEQVPEEFLLLGKEKGALEWKKFAENLYFLVASKDTRVQAARLVRALLAVWNEERKCMYKGEDGKDYYSREALESANQDYMDQMYTENKPRTM